MLCCGYPHPGAGFWESLGLPLQLYFIFYIKKIGGKSKMSKYLEFNTLEQKPKTKVIEIISKRGGERLGIIKWFPRWRQYAFYPVVGTIFNMKCLNDIISFIRGLR